MEQVITSTHEISKTLIRQQIDNFVQAFCTKDLTLMMSLYTSDFVSFDIVPPLQSVGRDTYRKVWEKTFAMFEDNIEIEVRDLYIEGNDDLAFTRQLMRLHATMKNGHVVNHWERLTFCFRKVDDQWLIAHEHVSVPADLAAGEAVLDLKP